MILLSKNIQQGLRIGIHKDGLRYKNIVLIITLAGQSRLFKTQDRDGTHRVAINDVPGRLVMIKAPGFQCMAPENRLLHGVDRVTKAAYLLAFAKYYLKGEGWVQDNHNRVLSECFYLSC